MTGWIGTSTNNNEEVVETKIQGEKKKRWSCY